MHKAPLQSSSNEPRLEQRNKTNNTGNSKKSNAGPMAAENAPWCALWGGGPSNLNRASIWGPLPLPCRRNLGDAGGKLGHGGTGEGGVRPHPPPCLAPSSHANGGTEFLVVCHNADGSGWYATMNTKQGPCDLKFTAQTMAMLQQGSAKLAECHKVWASRSVSMFWCGCGRGASHTVASTSCPLYYPGVCYRWPPEGMARHTRTNIHRVRRVQIAHGVLRGPQLRLGTLEYTS